MRLERKWWTLLGVCVASFMLLIDVTIVATALPSIQRELHAGLTSLQWVVDAYAVILAALILTAGSLADRVGRRRVFAAGVTIFTVTSLVCGLAGSATVLDIARGVQGVGGAAMFATGLALIAQEFEGMQRVRAIAAWGATVGLAVAIGPLAGGVLTEAFSWRWIFFVNIPLGVFTIVLARLRMSEFADRSEGRIDWAGLLCFSGALLLFVFALLRGNAEGWSSALIVASLAGASALLVAFVAIELRAPHPMLDLSLFRLPTFVGVSVGTLAIAAGMFAMFIYLSFLLQDGLGYSPIEAGLQLLPCSALVFLVPLLTRRLAARAPARVLLAGGLLLVSAGLFLMHGVTVTSRWTALLAGLVLAGVGIGFANPAIASTALGVVAPARSGMASGFSNTCRLGGVAIGIAALGAIFQNRISVGLEQRLGPAGRGLASVVASGGPRAVSRLGPAGRRATAVDASRHAFLAGFNELVLVGAGIVLVGALAAGLLIRARDFQAVPRAAPAPTAPEPAAALAGEDSADVPMGLPEVPSGSSWSSAS
jgi:EmrB/QacA subfamily drug resistance transporter